MLSGMLVFFRCFYYEWHHFVYFLCQREASFVVAAGPFFCCSLLCSRQSKSKPTRTRCPHRASERRHCHWTSQLRTATFVYIHSMCAIRCVDVQFLTNIDCRQFRFSLNSHEHQNRMRMREKEIRRSCSKFSAQQKSTEAHIIFLISVPLFATFMYAFLWPQEKDQVLNVQHSEDAGRQEEWIKKNWYNYL